MHRTRIEIAAVRSAVVSSPASRRRRLVRLRGGRGRVPGGAGEAADVPPAYVWRILNGEATRPSRPTRGWRPRSARTSRRACYPTHWADDPRSAPGAIRCRGCWPRLPRAGARSRGGRPSVRFEAGSTSRSTRRASAWSWRQRSNRRSIGSSSRSAGRRPSRGAPVMAGLDDLGEPRICRCSSCAGRARPAEVARRSTPDRQRLRSRRPRRSSDAPRPGPRSSAAIEPRAESAAAGLADGLASSRPAWSEPRAAVRTRRRPSSRHVARVASAATRRRDAGERRRVDDRVGRAARAPIAATRSATSSGDSAWA